MSEASYAFSMLAINHQHVFPFNTDSHDAPTVM